MEPKSAFRSAPLFERALAVASQRAHTCASLAEALGITPEEAALYWFSINSLRRSLGHDVPPLSDSASRCWYDPTWHLEALLEEFQINEGLASHYGRIFYDPEGGHLELNLAANEVVYAIALEHPSIDAARLRRVCVHACEPESGLELLAANAGKVLLAIEEYRDAPVTPAFVEDLYGRFVQGIEIREAEGAVDEAPTGEGVRGNGPDDGEAGAATAVSGAASRVEGLELLCSFISGERGPLAGQYGDHHLIVALTTLFFLCRSRLFPVGNAVFAYLLYLLLLHRAGYHFSAHVPVMRSLYGSEGIGAAGLSDAGGGAAVGTASDGVADGIPAPPSDPSALAVECDGTYDWTLVFERAVERILGEQRWVMTKLEGMSRRRDRLRAIIDADGSMNARQKEVLLEAVLHSNAEFTYDIHMKRYAISYPSARSDFGRLMDLGFLQQSDDGVRHFFFATDDLHERCTAYLREHCAEAYLRYYDEAGLLRPEFRATDEAPTIYNRDIGFYEKALLDKMYTEHYDFRRASIADSDGLMRRSHRRP